MGKLSVLETLTIEKEFDDSGKWIVKIKKNWTAGDAEAIADAQCEVNLSVDRENRKVDFEKLSMKVGRIVIAERIIVDWNATGEDDKEVPVTRENIEQLPDDVFYWIMEVWEGLPKKASARTSKSASS